MVDPLSITVATVVSYALPKLLDASLGKVGESLTESAIAQIKEKGQRLQQAIIRRVKPERQAAMQRVMAEAETSPTKRVELETWMEQAMQKSPGFAQEVRQLACQIHQAISIDTTQGRNVQQVGSGQGQQVNDPNAPVIQARDNNTFNF